MCRVRCDQCQFGMTSVDDAGNVGLARKATGFMTNDAYIAEAVDRRCFGGHDHIQLLNGRAKACEKYPPRLVAATLRALRQSMRAAGCGEAQRMMGRDRQLTIAALEVGPTLEELELLSILDSTGQCSRVQRQEHRIATEPWDGQESKRAWNAIHGWTEGFWRQRPGHVHGRNGHRSRLTGSTPTRATRSGPTTGARWFVRRRAGGQQLMWKIGQQRLPQLPCTRHSVCSWARWWQARGHRSKVMTMCWCCWTFPEHISTHRLHELSSWPSMTKSTSCSKQRMDYEMREHHSTERCLMQWISWECRWQIQHLCRTQEAYEHVGHAGVTTSLWAVGGRFATHFEMIWASTCSSREQLCWDPLRRWAMCKKQSTWTDGWDCTLQVQREVSEGSSRPTLDTLRFWSQGWAWVTQAKQWVLLVFGWLMRTVARNVMLRVELATDLGRCGPSTSVKTGVSCSSQWRSLRDGCSSRMPRTCKRPSAWCDSWKEVRGAWSSMAAMLHSKLWTSSQTATLRDARRPVGRLRTWCWAGHKLGRSWVLRIEQECFESSWRSCHGCWYGQGGRDTCTSGRHAVEGDSHAARSGTSETLPYPKSCG